MEERKKLEIYEAEYARIHSFISFDPDLIFQTASESALLRDLNGTKSVAFRWIGNLGEGCNICYLAIFVVLRVYYTHFVVFCKIGVATTSLVAQQTYFWLDEKKYTSRVKFI